MSGFNNRELSVINTYRSTREDHLDKVKNEQLKRQDHLRQLGLRALSEQIETRGQHARQADYQYATNTIFELAHAKNEGEDLTRGNIKKAALLVAGAPESPTRVRDIAHIYVGVPAVVDSIRRLNTGHFIPDQQYRSLKRNLAVFNHTLKDTIDNDQRISPEELFNYVSEAGLLYGYTGRTLQQLNRETKQSIEGMRHELAFEAALLRTDYNLLDTSIDDDMHGIDYKVELGNGKTLSIDVKSSQSTAIQSQNKQDEYHLKQNIPSPRDKLVMWSGFTSADFPEDQPGSRSQWRPLERSIQRAVPYIKETIEAASSAL